MSGFYVGELIHTDTETMANRLYSSQQTAYPADNAYDIDRRKRVWRTNGYWNIESGSNTIVFRETLLTDLTATITVDEYASDTLLFAAIKTALEAAGDSTYTVSRDGTTNNIQVASNGGGGGGIFQIIWTSSTAMAGILGYDAASDDTGALTYDADVLKLHTVERLTFDFGFPVNPTMFIAVNARNSPLQVSPSATIKLKANYTDSWSAPPEEFSVTYRENVLTHINEDGIAQLETYGYRYWAFEVVDASNPDGYIELGAVCLASHTTLTRGCPGFPFANSYEDRTVVSFSDGGQTLPGIRAKYQQFVLDWEALDKASFEALESVFEIYGLHSSFFIAMDQENAFSTDGETWVRLVKFSAAPEARLISPGNWSISWNLREEL